MLNKAEKILKKKFKKYIQNEYNVPWYTLSCKRICFELKIFNSDKLKTKLLYYTLLEDEKKYKKG